ncbi:MAG: hypothetical protein M3Q05_11565 [Bacteroidota bacterium]|nr:hypothetical protein [Bacteroidota bacterium]
MIIIPTYRTEYANAKSYSTCVFQEFSTLHNLKVGKKKAGENGIKQVAQLGNLSCAVSGILNEC